MFSSWKSSPHLRIAEVACFTFMASAAIASAQIAVTLRCANAPECNVKGVLSSEESDGKRSSYNIAGGSARIDSSGKRESTRILELSADGYWMPRRTITAAPSGSVDLPVWRTATVRGRFETVGATTTLPKNVSISFESSPGASGDAVPRESTVDCPMAADRTWQCALPATKLDVVMRVKNFVPHYVWDLKLAPRGVADMGTMKLRPGASFVAWLDTRTIKSLKAPATARLVRMTTASSPTLGNRLSVPVAEAAFNSRGVVQLAPVPPGTYTLEVDSRGFAPTRLGPITIYDARESSLRLAIVLDPPLVIRLAVTPVHDPQGVPWQVSLSKADPMTFRGSAVAEGPATGGVFKVDGQGPGRYTARIQDHSGNWYANREFDVHSSADAEQAIEIGALQLRGRVVAAGEPLAARLAFGGKSGAERIGALSDPDGRFEIVLPHAGKWPVDVDSESAGVLAALTVTVAEKQRDIEIKVPDTEVSGWVAAPGGKRVRNAVVTAHTTSGSVSRRVASDGTFRFRGLKPETIQLNATDPRTSDMSRFVAIPLSDGTRRDNIELVLQQMRTLKGTVTDRGQAVVGARITGYGFGAGPARQTRAVSNLDGSFDLSFPETVSQIALVVAAAGRTLQAFSTPPTTEPVALELASSGGVLRLTTAGMSRPGITYNGTPVPFNELLDWARAQGSTSAAGDVLEVPQVAPGFYRFCVNRDGRDACKDGTLAPGSVLALTP